VLAITGIEKAADRHAGKFSLGMSQRLGIAAALLGDPRILLLDEPVNGLESLPPVSRRATWLGQAPCPCPVVR
jgi:ABC-type multidrug transport system ATPase subunit